MQINLDDSAFIVEKCSIKKLFVDKFISPFLVVDELDFSNFYWKLGQIWDKDKATSFFNELLVSVENSLQQNGELPSNFEHFMGFLGLSDTSYDVDDVVPYNDTYSVPKHTTHFVCEVLEGGLSLLYVLMFIRAIYSAFSNLEQSNDFCSNERILDKIAEFKNILWFTDSNNTVNPRFFTTTLDDYGKNDTPEWYEKGLTTTFISSLNDYYTVLFKHFYDLSASLFSTQQHSPEQVVAFLDTITNRLSFVAIRSTDGNLIMEAREALVLKGEYHSFPYEDQSERDERMRKKKLYEILMKAKG